MSALSVNTPFPTFLDIDGQPLDAGYIYLGVANQATEANPIQAYWDAALSVPATQPILTKAGFPVNAGVPARVYVNSDYSIVVKNRNGFQVFSSPIATDRFNNAIDSSAVSFLQAGTGAVARTAQAKMRDVVSVKDFGAVGDGVADDTAAFTAAIAAAPGSGVRIYAPAGTYLISSKLTLSKEILLFGDGCSQTTGDDAATKILKGAAMTTALIDVTSASVSIEHIGFEGVTGNTGDGIHVKSSRCSIRNVSVHKMGQDGIRVGGDADENCNLFALDRVFTRNNGRHGVYVHDTLSTGGPDVNAGLISLHESANNGGDGLKIDKAWYVTVVAATPQTNTGYGINLTADSRYNTIVGGDQNEGNVAGEVYNAGLRNVFLGTDYSGFTDVGTYTAVVGSTGSKLYSPVFDSTGAGTDDGAVLAKGTLGSTIYPVRIRNTANAANGRGVGLEFQPPDGTNSYRTGGRITSEQQTTNKDSMLLAVNNSGVMQIMLGLLPNNAGVAPGTDNAYSSGISALRWSVVYAATGTINTSDERDKQDVAALDAAEKRVAVAIKGLVKKFRFKDAVQTKGDAARIHVGVIVQEVIAAFQAENLDPMRYGIVCYDQWDAEGDRPAGDRYGVRYEELLAFIIAAL